MRTRACLVRKKEYRTATGRVSKRYKQNDSKGTSKKENKFLFTILSQTFAILCVDFVMHVGKHQELLIFIAEEI